MMTKKEWSRYRTHLRRMFRLKCGQLDEFTNLTAFKKYQILQEIKLVDNILSK